MDSQRLAQDWQAMTPEVVTGMAEWRQQHPPAMLREIEATLDARWAVARARLLHEAALASTTADLGQTSVWPACPPPAGRGWRRVARPRGC